MTAPVLQAVVDHLYVWTYFRYTKNIRIEQPPGFIFNFLPRVLWRRLTHSTNIEFTSVHVVHAPRVYVGVMEHQSLQDVNSTVSKCHGSIPLKVAEEFLKKCDNLFM